MATEQRQNIKVCETAELGKFSIAVEEKGWTRLERGRVLNESFTMPALPSYCYVCFSGAGTCRLLGFKAETESELMNSIAFEEILLQSQHLCSRFRSKRPISSVFSLGSEYKTCKTYLNWRKNMSELSICKATTEALSRASLLWTC
jgi:hypothetical protein